MTNQQPTTITPTKLSERVEFVDILRGFAVFGILVANMAAYSGRSTDPANATEWLDLAIVDAIRFFIEAKFYSLFSFLFGWGMAVQMLRAQAKNQPFVPLYIRRLIILLVIGIIHGTLIWFGDILTVYAICGFVLLLFRNRSPRFLFITIALCLLWSMLITLPFAPIVTIREWYSDLISPLSQFVYPETLYSTGTFIEVTRRRIQDYLGITSLFFYFGNIFSMFLLGLYVGKQRLFQNIQQNLPLVKRVALLTFIIGIMFNGLFVYFNEPTPTPSVYMRFARTATRTIGAPSLMLFYVSAIILLLQTEPGRRWLAPLANVGRLALTNYLSQSLIGTFIFYNYGLGLYGLVDATFGLILTIVICIGQIHFSRWWLDQYQFGPVEWLWRSLTYGRRQPLPHGQTLADLPPLLSKRGQWLTAVFLTLILIIGGTYWTNSLPESEPVVANDLQPVTDEELSAASNQPRPTPTPIATPSVNPVAYTPSPLIATGDLKALVQSWDVDEAMHHIETLASPDYEGRLAGSPGGKAAADYIATQFAAYGLQPAGDNGTYFQAFPITYTELSAAPELTVFSPDNTAVSQTRFQDYNPTIFSYAGSGSGRGPVIWLDDCQPDDFAGQDLVGKIPLCQNIVARADIATASRLALEYGTAGLLLFTDPDFYPPNFGNIYRETWVPNSLPTFRVYPDLAQDLLLGSSTTITDLLNTSDPLPLATEVELSLAAPAATVHAAHNVLGVIPGRDPNYAHEVVVIGGHFDHLGHTPDGTIWAGANDNASGIAALLEIARSWHEQGYVPRRTVLFAAWDGEEHGLFGSIYYVQHPRYPLADTEAAIQMDMVGTGIDTLSISSGPLAQKLTLAAESLGIESAVINLGRSDHVPFLEAGVPASLIIWVDENVDIPSYHRPLDLPEVIEPAKLTAAAQVAETTLLTLADSEPAIRDLLSTRVEAVKNNDLNAFLATSHPNLRAADSRWFTDLQQLNPQAISLHPSAINIRGDEATVNLDLGLDITGTKETVPLTIRLSRTDAGWQWHGADLNQKTFDDVAIAYPPEITIPFTLTAQLIQSQLKDITSLLSLQPPTDATFLFLPDEDTLRATTSLSLPTNQTSWVESGLVKLIYSPQISSSHQLTETLAQLILANAGLNQSDAPWLWHGLPLLLQEQADPITTQKQLLPNLQAAITTGDFTHQPALDWAAVSYLQQRLGWRDLGQFIQDAGRNGVETALQEVVGTSDFSALWQQDWRSRLNIVQTELDILMNNRVTAVMNNELTTYLSTIDSTVPTLEASESHWFHDAQQKDMSNFNLAAQPIALMPNGDILADVTWQYNLGEAPLETVTLTRLFTGDTDNLLWAGTPLNTLADTAVTIRYPKSHYDLAQTMQQDAKIIYLQLADQLQITNPLPLTIELIETVADLQQSIAPSFGTVPGWTAPNSGLKLQVTSDYHSTLAIQLSRQLLHQKGVSEEWLLKGVSLLLARPFDSGQTQATLAPFLPELQTAAQNDTLPDLFALPDDDQLSAARLPLARAAAWDAVRYLVESYGWNSLLALLNDHNDTNARTQIGMTLPAFAITWRDSLAQGHVQPEWIEAAQAFDTETAIHHLNTLTNPDWNGRLAGTDGADQAAQYIAEQFAAYGLQPAGENNSYFQQFPITHTELLYAPRLAFAITDTAQVFTYRQDFLLAHPSLTSTVSADLIWLQSPEAEGNLTGKIILMPPPPNLDAITLNQLAERGAVGLILPTFKREEAELLGRRPLLSTDLAPFPIYELTSSGYTRLLEAIGQNRVEMDTLPSYFPLNLTAHLDTPLSPPTATTTANILALLPGSDPFLSQEMIIIGAHYDHVGNDPDTLLCPADASGLLPANTCQRSSGPRYTGTNDNASGVAVLLTLAHNWQEIGYQPQRTILFAAWGAQEMGQLGSTYFVMTPTQPLTHVIAMLQLDGVGGGDGFSLGAQGNNQQDSLLLQLMSEAATLLDEKLLLTEPTAVSDQIPFREAGFPTVLVAWRLADDNNLPDEAAFAVHEGRLATTGRLVTLAMMNLAR